MQCICLYIEQYSPAFASFVCYCLVLLVNSNNCLPAHLPSCVVSLQMNFVLPPYLFSLVNIRQMFWGLIFLVPFMYFLYSMQDMEILLQQDIICRGSNFTVELM
jgi:hypothetical protein